MTNAEAREAFIAACEAAEHIDAVKLPVNTAVMVGGCRFRVVYDPVTDTCGLIAEAEWYARLALARQRRNEVRVELKGNEHARVVTPTGTWIIAYDGTIDEFVARRVDKAAG